MKTRRELLQPAHVHTLRAAGNEVPIPCRIRFSIPLISLSQPCPGERSRRSPRVRAEYSFHRLPQPSPPRSWGKSPSENETDSAGQGFRPCRQRQHLWFRRLDAARRAGDGGDQPVPGHAAQIAGDGGGGLKPNAPADFPDGRAEAVRSAEFPDKLQNLLRFAVIDSLRHALTSSQTAHSTNQRPTCGERVSGLCSKNSSRS